MKKFLISQFSFLNSYGFTLIELLIAISIISILSVIGFTSFQGVQSRSRDSERKQDLKALAYASEIYFQKNGVFIDGTPATDGDCASSDTNIFYLGIGSYMENGKVPVDPLTKNNYCYTSVASGGSFRLFATLEGSDSEAIACGTKNYYSVTSQDLTNSCPPGETPTPVPACTGLVAYWKMDDAGPTSVADFIGTNTGTATNGLMPSQPGKLGTSWSFDGVDDYIDVGSGSDLNTTTAFTIAAWINPSTLSGHPPIVIKTSDPDKITYFLIINDAGGVSMGVKDNNAPPPNNLNASSTTILSAGNWYHVAGTYSGTSLRVFVNGVYEANDTTTIAFPPPSLPNIPTQIGDSTIDSFWGEFNGRIDEVGIWNRALTPPEISTLYNSGAGKTC